MLQEPGQVTNTVETTDTADDENERDIDSGDENGWGDDDIDLDDEDDEHDNGENMLDHDQSAPPYTKKVEEAVSGSNNHEGRKDDDLSDADTTPDQVNKNGTGDEDTLSQPKDLSTEETEQSGSANDDEHSFVGFEAIPANDVSLSIDNEAVQEREAQMMKPAHATTSSANNVARNESNEDDFVAKEALPKSLPKKSVDKEPLIPREKPLSVSSSAPSPSTPAISAEALAAVMAAEREAELMVQEAMNARLEKPAKKPKRKKDPEAKKKEKKKKKEKRKDSD
jgi:hypothetical protein